MHRSWRFWRFCVFLIALHLASPSPSAAREARPAKRPRPPAITPDGGRYTLNEVVTVGIRAEAGCAIIYTVDGSYPAVGRGTRVDNRVASFALPPGDVTVMAVAVRPGLPASPTAVAKFVRAGN